MRTARLKTVCALVGTRCQYWWGEEVPQVKKFEQVFSHQMSLSGLGPRSGRVQSLMSKGGTVGEGERSNKETNFLQEDSQLSQLGKC